MKATFFTKNILLVLILLLLMLSGSCKEKQTQYERLEKFVRKFSAYMVEKTIFADCKDGFPYLLKAIKIAASEHDYYPELKDTISQIETHIKKSSILNPVVAKLLHKAYSFIQAEKKLEPPLEIIGGDSIEEYCRNKIEEALSFYRSGSSHKTVLILLEIAILTVTPIP